MTSWPTITRAEVLARAKQGFGDGLRTVPYSQQRIVGGYRTDCSGYVCRVLGLTEADAAAHGADWWGGLNTVTLVTSGALRQIKPSELRAGDVIGTCGPGTAGDAGHVAIFGGWDSRRGDNWFHIYEQAGGSVGPIYRSLDWGPDEVGDYVRNAYVYAGFDNEGDDDVSASDVWGWDGIPAPKDSASYATNKKWTAGNALADAVRAARAAERQGAANAAAIKVLATSQGLDPDKVYAAIEAGSQKAVAEALAHGAGD